MIESTRLTVRILDFYYDEPVPDRAHADIVRCNQFSRPFSDGDCVPFATIVLDLSAPIDVLLSNVKPQTRYKIRRASDRDGLEYRCSSEPDASEITRFADYFDHCASLKGIGAISRTRLMLLARQRALELSCVLDAQQAMLAANCYLVTAHRVRILHTAAAFRDATESGRRNMIGRANRYLYWRDILRLRESNVQTYDFGGWYTGDADAERLRINRFKEEFGGEIRHEWNCRQAITIKGSLVVAALKRRGDFIARRSVGMRELQEHEDLV